jgi:hypothetical protein
MSLFPTSLLLQAIAAESHGPTTPSPADSSAHMPSASHIHDVPSAFRWIIANHYATQPASPPRSVRIVADKGTCNESECAPHENVVTVLGSKVTFWYRPYSEPGAPPFVGYPLHGLFDFMRAVIWQRLIDERKIDRFLLEPGLVGEEKEAVDHYQALREEAARLADADIQWFLSDHAVLKRLYSAARTGDLQGLEQCARSVSSEIERVGVEQVRDLINAMADGDEAASRSARVLLTTRILQCAMAGLPVEAQLDWRSAEDSRNGADTSRQIKVLDALATRWYALQFERVCLSNGVLDLGRRIFFAESGESEPVYRARVSAECKPKAVR